MTAAIFGLIGVIVGAVLTQLRERAKERAETRAIARVVSHELLQCLTPVAAADRHGEAYMLKDLPSGECRDHRLDMARLLTKPGDWESVSNAYEALGMTKTFATTNAAVKRDFTPPEQGARRLDRAHQDRPPGARASRQGAAPPTNPPPRRGRGARPAGAAARFLTRLGDLPGGVRCAKTATVEGAYDA
ncbi:MAG: hypothetical protein H0X55_02680 [Thermoleophilaceae bacterium]|nr:hypothetical protein [Thermoleophilaceae bacterium]